MFEATIAPIEISPGYAQQGRNNGAVAAGNCTDFAGIFDRVAANQRGCRSGLHGIWATPLCDETCGGRCREQSPQTSAGVDSSNSARREEDARDENPHATVQVAEHRSALPTGMF